MANPEHVAVVKRGAAAISTWRAKHVGERLDLSEADLQQTDLQRADLQGANLKGAYLKGANLEGAYLQEVHLEGAYLAEVDLQEARLRGVNLQGAYLQRADLQGADLEDGNLRKVNLNGANLQAAYLDGADLTGAYFNRETQFDNISISGETKGLDFWIFSPEKYILREIEFPPEYHQAGMSIMTYFSTILRQKYPDIPTTVQITQEELTVRMTIETDDGDREIIEKTLQEYGLVVSGKQEPSALLPNPIDVFRLENQLSLAQVQLESERRALQLTEQQFSGRIESLESEVIHLRRLVGDQLHHADRLADLLEAQALAPLRTLFDRGLTEADKPEVQRILTETGQHSPHLLQRLAEQITSGAIGGTIGGTIGGVNATLLAPWLQDVADKLGVVIRLAT